MADGGHILVVGASSGIGYALAERLASSHAVSAIARRSERLAPLQQLGVKAYAADISDLASIPALLQSIVEAQGPLTGLIYCAGAQKIKPMRSIQALDVEQLYGINLLAPTVMAGQFASRRISSENAVFCAISSIAADRPEPGIVAYSASKAGLNGLIRGLARELGPRRIVGVAPGWIDTEMTQAYPHLYNDAFREKLKKETPAAPATIDGVVKTVLFLMSPAAESITGEIIRVDGGASL
ncbi:MAG: SDR family oxidoreductase [Burkholderiales bacterium]|nr:MAG: SDR family oxidoreductase [Burkholderiales bacterium]